MNKERVSILSECWKEYSELEYQLFKVHEQLGRTEGQEVPQELRTR